MPRATAGTDSSGLYSHVNRKEGSGPVARPQQPVAQTIPAARPKSETAQKLAAINEQSGLHRLNALPSIKDGSRKPLDTGSPVRAPNESTVMIGTGPHDSPTAPGQPAVARNTFVGVAPNVAEKTVVLGNAGAPKAMIPEPTPPTKMPLATPPPQ